MTDELELNEEEEEEQEEPGPELLPMDFSIFVLSLNTSALVHLGEAPAETGPQSFHQEVNLPLARQTIDMIAMLEEKTRGNLTGREEHLLNQVLFDLRMRYTRSAR